MKPRRNPHDNGSSPHRPSPEEIKAAEKAFAKTHGGRRPNQLLYGRVPVPGPSLASLGPVVAVEYLADKAGPSSKPDPAIYRHEFEGNPPLLSFDPSTKSLHFVGGDYTVTSHGVEDMPGHDRERFAVISNPGGSAMQYGYGGYGRHPMLSRRFNPFDSYMMKDVVGGTALAALVGFGLAIGAKWAMSKVQAATLNEWQRAAILMGAAVVIGCVVAIKYRRIGVGIAAGVGAVGAVDLFNWYQTRPSAGLPDVSDLYGMPAASGVFTPFPAGNYYDERQQS